MHNLKLTFRNFKKNKLYSSFNIVGFAIGFAVTLIAALIIYNELNVDQCFPHHAHIYRLVDAENNKCDLDYKLSQVLAEHYPEIELVCPLEYHTGQEFPLTSDHGASFIETIASTNNNFFKAFSVQVERMGDMPFMEKNSVAISESLAQKLFQDGDALGKPITLGGFLSGIVTAVIKDFPNNTSFNSDVYLNAENKEFRLAKHCDNGDCYTPTNHYLLLQQDVNPTEFTQKLNKTFPDYQNRLKRVQLQELSNIYLDGAMEGSENQTGSKPLIGIFGVIGLLVIVLSCINYFNFSISLQHKHLKETGIKKVNGAGLSNLANYYLTEVATGVFISLILSVSLVILFLPEANQLFRKELDLMNLLHTKILVVVVSIVVTVIIINVLATMYVLLKFDIRSFLSGTTSTKGKKGGLGWLTVFQFAASMVLIVVVLTIQKQVDFVKVTDLGFEKEHFLRLNFPYRFEDTETIKKEIKSLSFVEKASLSIGTPGRIINHDGSNNGENSFYLEAILADMDFFDVFGLQLTEGRQLSPADIGKSCIMNEAAIKRYGWDSVEGKKFDNRGGLNVVGAVKDFHIASLHSNIKPVCIIPHDAKGMRHLSIRLVPGNISQQMDAINQVWNTFIPDTPIDYTFYDTYFNSLYKEEERLAKAIGILSVIALLITGMGLMGQIVQISIQRTKEIGVRKVNGAKISEILTLLNKDFIKWLTIAFVIACPVAYYSMNKWLENFAYKTSLSWWIFVLAGVLALVIALLTVSFQSYKAATRNPVEALRYE